MLKKIWQLLFISEWIIGLTTSSFRLDDSFVWRGPQNFKYNFSSQIFVLLFYFYHRSLLTTMANINEYLVQ